MLNTILKRNFLMVWLHRNTTLCGISLALKYVFCKQHCG